MSPPTQDPKDSPKSEPKPIYTDPETGRMSSGGPKK